MINCYKEVGKTFQVPSFRSFQLFLWSSLKLYSFKHTFAIFIKIPIKTYNFKLALKKQEFSWINLWMDEFETALGVKVGVGIGYS